MNKTITQFPLRATRMLFAVLLMTMTTQTAWADERDGWVFEKNQPGTECYVTKYTGNTSVSELIIPSTLDGAKVISISGINFSSFENLVTLKFPSGCVLTSMPSVTNCSNLSNIMDGTISNRLPSSITTIERNCFKGTAITKLTMPGVTSVDANAFEGCPLQEVSFGQAATIKSWAFANITTVCNISYPGPMTNWGPDKYVYSNNLLVSGTDNEKDWFCGWCGGTNGSGNYLYWTVDTEGQMTIKPRYDSFDSDKQVFTTLRWNENNIKTKIKSVTIQDVYSICDDAFNGCAALTSVSLSRVTTIGNNAFSGCNSLSTVNFADGSQLTTIGDGAFSGTALTTITIPASVTSIGEFAFINCPALTAIAVDEGNSVYKSVDGVLFSKDVSTLICFPDGKSDFTFPPNTTSIAPRLFYFCSPLTKVTIPASVTTIGKEAFKSCSCLSIVNLAEGSQLATIGESAFNETALTTVTIPASVTTIGNNSFDGCTSLSSVIFAEGSQLTTIGESAFYGTALTTVTIPATVMSIGNDAFSRCFSLSSVIFAEGSQLKTIEKGAFYETALTAVTIPSSVTTICESAFMWCSSLSSVIFAEGSQLTTIGRSAFSGLGLKSVTIPASVMSIGIDAFYSCTNLTSVCIECVTPPTLNNANTVFFDNASGRKIYVPINSMDAYKTAWTDYTDDIGALLSEAEGITAANATAIADKPVAFTRSFTKTVNSTICLPFELSSEKAAAAGTFYTFSSVDADWTTVTMEAANLNSGALAANTPYLFVPGATKSVVFSGIMPATVSTEAGTTPEGDWTFTGTYVEKRWDVTQNTEEIGRIFGFATGQGYGGKDASSDTSPGDFIRLNSGGIKPFRAYLKYTGNLARTRGEGGLPERMTVRLVGANGEIQGIGEIRLSTGEVTFDSRAWYDLNGRRLEGKPSEKGIYINGGRKVVIK